MAIDVPVIIVFAPHGVPREPAAQGRTFFRAVFFLPVVIAPGEVLQRLYPQLQETGNTLGSTATVTRGWTFRPSCTCTCRRTSRNSCSIR